MTLNNVDISFIPVFVREGAIVPMASTGLQYTDMLPGGPLTVYVYGCDNACTSSFDLFEDDGTTINYENGSSDVKTTTFNWNQQTKSLSWTVTGSTDDTHVFTQVNAVLITKSGIFNSATSNLGNSGSISF
jgi:alpha-glucosidase